MSKDLAIKLFLGRLKAAVRQKRVLFIERAKNIQLLFDLSLTVNDVFAELYKLTSSDYVAGPENDYDMTDGQIWKFLHPILNTIVYVKLKLYCFENRDWIKIISFHKGEDRA